MEEFVHTHVSIFWLHEPTPWEFYWLLHQVLVLICFNHVCFLTNALRKYVHLDSCVLSGLRNHLDMSLLAVMRSLPFPFRLPCYVSLFRTPAYVNPPFFSINWDKPTISWCRVNNIMGPFENRHVNFIFGLFVYQGPKWKKVCIDIQFQKVDVM